MKKILCLIGLSSIVWASTVMHGAVDLKNEVYQKLTVHGDATLQNVVVEDLIVNGTLKADTLTAKKILVHGSIEGKAIKADILEASGSMQLTQSTIDQVSGLGEMTIRGLKAKNVYIYVQPPKALYALRARNVIVKTTDALELKVGDACYIDSIRFTDTPGKVYVMKDRSYVGDIVGGTLHR